MIEVDFFKEHEELLDKLAKLMNRTKDSLIKEIIEDVLPRLERRVELRKR